MTLLSDSEIEDFIADYPAWSQVDWAITRAFQFDDFNASIGFVNRVALAAEEADHHPDIDIRWNKVVLTLSTHSAGGLTKKDLDLAATADGLT